MLAQHVSAGLEALMIRNLLLAVVCGLLWSVSVSSQQLGANNELPNHYFWNEVTGDTQLEDPGDVPLHDEAGNCYWLDDGGQRLDQDPNAGKYAWVEMYSEEHKRPFYYDQQNHISTWDKPADLAWRRVYFPAETDNHAEGATAAGNHQSHITEPTGDPDE